MTWENIYMNLVFFGGIVAIGILGYLAVSIIHKKWWTEQWYLDDDED